MNDAPTRWPEGWTDAEAFEALRRMIRKQDYWRGYFGDGDASPTDEQVIAWLDRIEGYEAALRLICKPELELRRDRVHVAREALGESW